MRQRTETATRSGTSRGRTRVGHRRAWLLRAAVLAVVPLAAPAHAVTFPWGTFLPGSPTMVLRDGAGVALGAPAPATALSARPTYTFEIDAVPPSYFRVDGAYSPIILTFGDSPEAGSARTSRSRVSRCG